MPQLIDKDSVAKLESLNSVVKFETSTCNVYDDKGELRVNKLDNRPVQKTVVIAALYTKHDMKQWCSAEGGDEPNALANVLEKSGKVARPAATAAELAAENKALREKLAAAEAETERVRSAASSQAIKPDDSQARRSAAKAPEPVKA